MSRPNVAGLRRRLFAARASLPPVVRVADSAHPERVAEADREVEAIRATGRRAFVVLVDRDEEPRP